MRLAAGWMCSFAALFALWLLVVVTVAREEVIAGLVAAAIGATAGQVARALGLGGPVSRALSRVLAEVRRPCVSTRSLRRADPVRFDP
jgi:hypothetical protein